MEPLAPGNAAFIGLMSVWLTVAVIGNICVVLVVIRNKKMRNGTNVFISNLAVSDVCLGAIVLPMGVHDVSHTADFHEGEVACKMVTMLPVLCITCSVYSLVAISFERLRAIVYHTRPPLSVSAAKKISLSIWIVSVLICVPTAVEYSVFVVTLTDLLHNESNTTESLLRSEEDAVTVIGTTAYYEQDSSVRMTEYLECGSEMSYTYSFVNGIFLLMLSYIIPMILMGVNYGRIVHFVIKRAAQVGPEENEDTSIRTITKKNFKVVKMLIIVAVLFVLCWLPYFTLLMAQKVSGNDGSAEADGVVNMLRISLAVFSTSYNVVLYVMFSTNFRRAFQDLFCGNKCCRSKTKMQAIELDNGTSQKNTTQPG